MFEGTQHYLKHYTQLFLFITLGTFLLYQGRLLFIPLSFAILISFMYYPLGKRVERLAGRTVSVALCLALLLLFGFLLFQLFSSSVVLLQEKFTGSREKLLGMGDYLVQTLDRVLVIPPEQHAQLAQRLYENLLQSTVPLVTQTISGSAGTLAILLIIPIFVSLILFSREMLVQFAVLLVPKEYQGRFMETLREMSTTYFKFAKGMALVYVVVGVLNSAGFLLLGLPNAVYFGVLASVLTFFPYIGIFIGGSAALLVAFATYDSLWYPFGVIAVLAVVQYLEANVIFPILVGRQLKISPFATLVAIIVGGIIWGGAGMVLFVPFAAILKLFSDRVESLKPLSVLLSEGK